MIEVQGLSKLYGDEVAADHGVWRVESGEVFGLIGPNGAGKTTTLKILAGLIDPSSGSASINGNDIVTGDIAHDLGFLPETSPLYEDMTAIEYLHFFADLYDVPETVADDRIHDTLNRLSLEKRDTVLGSLSKGMQRKVAIARALINDPPVLIFDEPASGLDPTTTEQIIQFTEDLRDDGKAILFSAHDLQQVESVCDRVALMNHGEIIVQGTIAELREEHASKQYTIQTDVPVPNSDSRDGDRFQVTVPDMDGVNRVRESAQNLDGEILDIESRESALQDIFLEVTGAVDGDSE
jgi:ABC-2 type transport system ATP-binding protein